MTYYKHKVMYTYYKLINNKIIRISNKFVSIKI